MKSAIKWEPSRGEVEAAAGLVDLPWFCGGVLGLRMKAFHRRMCEHVSGGAEFILNLAPTGFGKTQVVTIGYALQLGLVDANVAVLVVCHTEKYAQQLSDEMRQWYEGPEIVSRYGVQEGKKWTSTKFSLKRRTRKGKEHTFTFAGAGQAIEGGHYDYIIGDDLVTMLAARSPSEREKLRMWVWQVLWKRRKPRTVFIFSGTRYHPKDLYQTFIDLNLTTPGRVAILRQAALLLDGQPVDPAIHPNQLRKYQSENRLASLWEPETVKGQVFGYSVDQLIQERTDEGPISFGLSRQNDVEQAKGSIFKGDWFRWYAGEVPWRDVVAVCTGVDAPVKKQEIHDFYANYSIAVTGTGRLYLLPDMVLDRLTIGQMVDVTVQKHLQRRKLCPWASHRTDIEGVAAQHWLSELVKTRMAQDKAEDWSHEVTSILPEGDKTLRAWRLQPVFEQARVLFPNGVRLAHITATNLEQFPDVEHDDDFDALEIALTRARKVEFTSASMSNRFVPNPGSGMIDGYDAEELYAKAAIARGEYEDEDEYMDDWEYW